jgi:hypothetical protein
VTKTFEDICDELNLRQMTYVISKANLASDDLYGSSFENHADGRIEIFGHFLKVPLTGQDAKFGVIVHETSHNVSHQISDQNATYSLAETEELARSALEKAVHCAERFEYYVEFGVSSRLITPAPDYKTTTGWVQSNGYNAPIVLASSGGEYKNGGEFKAWANKGKGSYLDQTTVSPHPVRDPSSSRVGENQRSRWLDAPAQKTGFCCAFYRK